MVTFVYQSFNSDLAKLRKGARRAWNRWQKDKEPYKEAMKVYGKTLRRYDRSSRTFCSGVEGIVPAVRLSKALSKDENYQIGNLKLPSGSYTTSDSEVVSHLLETLP
jgi:hypothetical protein